LGTHTLTLTIRDDNEPPEELTESAAFSLVSATNVPGMLALYYEGVPGDGEGSPESMIESVPPNADYAERLEGLNVSAQGGRISQTPYTGVVMAVMHGRLAVTNMATYTFQTTGGITNKLFVDDAEYTGPVMLMTGMHDVEARFAVDALSNLPLYVEYAAGAEPTAPIPGTLLSHNELDMPPVINSAPSSGSTLGGNNVEITGMGFFPSDEVIVHWGASDLTGALLQVTSGQIQLVTPPSNGLIHVTVETPNGVSDSFPYLYSSDGPAPVDFTMTNVAAVAAPSQAAWGPDQRLYVASVAGTITALAFDDRYNVTNTQVITTLETNSNNNILGIAFNPFDDPYNPRIYVAHGQLFANGGACFDGFSPYSGAVSILGGTNFETVEQLISGLPVSNHDHGINGLQFDNSGNLLIAIGGNSNAGITNCNMGALPESPLSAAILKAHIRRTNFNGRVCYVESGTAVTNMDQTGGDMVDVVEGVDVEVYAPGFRNPFDLVFTTDGRLYVTDNGPNAGFGGASLSATNSGPDPEDNDTLNLAMQGHYYGHPNRNRGRYDGRQNVYHGNAEASDPGHFSQAMGEFQPSTDGIDEYRADTFNGAMRGELLIQKWNGPTWRIALSTNGRQIASAAQLPVDLNGLDVIHAPGGTIIGVDYTDHAVKVAHPDDISAIDPTAWDFFPWRAPAETNIPFVIGGAHFNPDTNVVISIGGVSAEVTRVSSGRIHGIIPTPADPSSAWKDVTVVNGAYTSGLTRAFRYLLPTGAGTGTWHSLAPMPHALGEVAAGVINGMLYIVGEGHPATVAFDTFSGQWVSDRAARPYVSDHHAAEVIEDRLYLFGGFDGAADKVQIYDPAADTWTLGSNIPWQAGSPASAVIDGRVYLAGGIQNNTTVTFNAVYDPDADTWSMLASMPAGRNHAASATDGERLYIFGGRGPGSGDGNVVAEGFDDVQIYDPDTDTWETSFDPGSTIPPLPQQRGGTGKAVYRNDEFYIMGGETTDQGQGAVAGDVYNRVDVYHPATQTWRLDAPLPTPRHGIFPLLYDDAIYVGGGGTSAGYGVSDVFEKITR
jgi:glucose/arabinose dehydrogenase